MATQLADVVIPELFDPIALKLSTYLSVFFQTGAMASNDMVQGFASGNYGQILHLPFYNDLARTESGISSDDPADVATADKITETDQLTVKNMRAYGWSSADLVAALNGRDPMNAIASRVGQYWADQIDIAGMNMLTGVKADNIANDAGDMVYTSYSDVVAGSITGDMLISAENVIRAKATAGDHSEGFDIIAMHSSQYHRLQVLNLIDFIPDSEGRINMPTYLGMRVIVSDQVESVAGTNSTAYTAYLMKSGAIMFGDGAPKTPSETWRRPDQGGGEGVEELWTRRHWIAHVDGTSNIFTVTDGLGPTWAELADATSWNRVVADRKQVQLAYLVTN
jgi:hypothetical protein